MILSASMNDGWLPEGDGPVHLYRKGERMDDGLPDAGLSILKELGFTLLQLDTPFCTMPKDNGDGKWDGPYLDMLMQKCKDKGFDTAYFSRWHWPPQEVENSPAFSGLVCLEHGKSIPCWSIWNPKSLAWIEQCAAALQERYNAAGKDTLDVLYMGVHGDYGETMYPLGGSSQVLTHDRGIAEPHLHLGYWCADPYAVGSFQDTLQSKYTTLEGLNSAWNSTYTDFKEVAFPASPLYGKRRPWLDFIEWYSDSMTTFASDTARISRKHFRQNLIAVPVGGGNKCVQLGQDETNLAKQMKKHNVAIRSTAGCATHLDGSEATEAFCRNYPYLKSISTACKFYGTSMWIEPPYPPGPSGMAMLWGLFDALSCGVDCCMHWSKTVLDNKDFFQEYRDLFTVEKPVVDTAVLFPTTNHRIRSADFMPNQFVDLCSKLRRAADYDVLDEQLIRDGALQKYSFLLLAEGTVFEKDTLDAIRTWVEKGGMFLLYNTGFPLETVEGDCGYTDVFTGINPASVFYPPAPTTVTYRAKEFLSHAASNPAIYLPSVTNVSEGVNVLVTSSAEEAVVWEKPLGKGRCITFAGDYSFKDVYLDIARDCIFNRHVLDPTLKSALPITDSWDDVFSTLTEDWLFILNYTDKTVTCKYGDQDVSIKPWSLERVAR